VVARPAAPRVPEGGFPVIIATLPRWQRGRAAGLAAAAVAVALAGTAQPASAAPARNLHFVTIDVPGAADTRVDAINNNGVVAGSYLNLVKTKGFIMAGGKITSFSYPGAFETVVTGINDQGEAVGTYFGTNNANGAFLRSPSGHLTAFKDPLAEQGGTFADGINNNGVVVGGYVDSRGATRGFIYQSGRFTTISVPHGFYGEATFGSAVDGINDAGVMVGTYTPSKIGVNEGYVDNAGRFVNLIGPPPGTFPTDDIEVNGISGTGVIVGYSSNSHGVDHGWFLSHQQYSPLNDPHAQYRPSRNGEVGTMPAAINGHGVVVGTYVNEGGVEHGFMVSTGSGQS
jgi:hypothetical protein